VEGRQYPLETSDLSRGVRQVSARINEPRVRRGGAALGRIIGAIAGGGKGAAIGAWQVRPPVLATQGLTAGKAVRIPSETLLRFKLEARSGSTNSTNKASRAPSPHSA